MKSHRSRDGTPITKFCKCTPSPTFFFIAPFHHRCALANFPRYSIMLSLFFALLFLHTVLGSRIGSCYQDLSSRMLFQTVTSSPEVGDLWLILRHRVSRSSWRELKAACVKIRVHFVNMNLLEEVFFFFNNVERDWRGWRRNEC